MYQLLKKNELAFAIIWIVIYVISFSNADLLSSKLGIEKSITAIVGLCITLYLSYFLKRHGRLDYYGLCRFKGQFKHFLYFIPLIFVSSINLWNGIHFKIDIQVIFFMLSMVFVGFLEELIFRGFLFKAILKDDIKLAFIISSLSFGMGHIINIFLGYDLMNTILQLFYASAMGFCFSAIYYVGKSLIPCIVAHSFINALSILANPFPFELELVAAVVQIVVGLTYGYYLLKNAQVEHL